ncbi:hypothetical protein [Nonomuraea sp. NPDC050540]|uniref:hypothetical protein n=1 Tax=Nonomuraea sp. NPDC050540 TaxID=3364367 RepID=UPI0037A8FBDB
MTLTEEEVARVRRHLEREDYHRRAAAEENQSGFMRWLGNVGLTFIAQKLIGCLWSVIKSLFGLSAL